MTTTASTKNGRIESLSAKPPPAQTTRNFLLRLSMGSTATLHRINILIHRILYVSRTTLCTKDSTIFSTRVFTTSHKEGLYPVALQVDQPQLRTQNIRLLKGARILQVFWWMARRFRLKMPRKKEPRMKSIKLKILQSHGPGTISTLISITRLLLRRTSKDQAHQLASGQS